MRPFPPLLAALAALTAIGCDAPVSRQPTAPSAFAAAKADDGTRRIEMLDACDPASFDAVLGAGACVRPGGVAFSTFIDQLTRRGTIGSWSFAPALVAARVGQTLLAINRGGEVHTFTEVEEFGGGIVPSLNTLTGNTTPAPECLALGGADFIAPGASTTDDVEEEGTERYQCCIHPWMRTTVVASER